MKKYVVILTIGIVFAALAEVTTMPSNCFLNLVTNDKTTGYNIDTACLKCPNLGYDFYWKYYDYCNCVCLCCPFITIGSPRPFYVSKQVMNGNEFNNIALLQDTMVFYKCSTTVYPFPVGCKMAAMQFDCRDPDAKYVLYSKLIVIQLTNNTFVPLKIRSVYGRNLRCPFDSLIYSISYDSIVVVYGTSLSEIPRCATHPSYALVNSIRNEPLITVSGRSLRGHAFSRGIFIDGNMKTIRVDNRKKAESQTIR